MHRTSRRRRGIARSSSVGWGHRAVYAGAALATAALVAGFALAGFYFGAFSHSYNQTSASGLESSPFGVEFLNDGAMGAMEISYLNFTNWNDTTTSGPCTNFTNATTVSNPLVFGNSSDPNQTQDSSNLSAVFVCLNGVSNSVVNETWWQGLQTNYTQNGTLNQSVMNETAYYNDTLANITGNASTPGNVSIKGCLPFSNNSTALADCPFFVGNNNTTYESHTCYNDTLSLCYNASWHPNEYGYFPYDSVFFASVLFNSSIPGNTTFELVVSFAGATPVPQIFYLNTGGGGNNTSVTAVFDMTAAWLSEVPASMEGNLSAPFSFASVKGASLTVSECYPDANGNVACPNSLGGSGSP